MKLHHIAVAALPAIALLSAPALAARDSRPIACIYEGTKSASRADLSALVKNNFQGRTNNEKMLSQRIGEISGGCTSRYGWAPKDRDGAFHFFLGRVLREDAIYNGEKLGLTAEHLDAAVAALSPALKADAAQGKVTSDVLQTAFAALKTAGVATDALSATDQQLLAQNLGQGLIGTTMQANAEATFMRR